MSGIKRGVGRLIALWLILAVATAGCSVNPATGKKQIALVGEGQEIAIGQENDQQIVAAMGLYPDDEVQAYVQRLGSELAAKSERPDLPWTFRVLDDSTVNAFALPGGYIYVTRGIMTHLNTEAELVSILGHEIGHVTARHGVNQMSKQQLLGIGLMAGMIVAPELQRYGDLMNAGLGMLFLKYSRDDERQADELGLRYTVRGGWDAREMPGVFQVLKGVSEASGSGRVPSYLSTHPDPDNRTRLINEQIVASGVDLTGFEVNRPAYMNQIDGMVFGMNPREGFFDENNRFKHPDLAFRVDFPRGWKGQNARQSVGAVNEEQDAAVVLTLAQEDDPSAAAQAFANQEGLRTGRIQRGRIGGFPAAQLEFQATTGDGAELHGSAAFVRYGENTFRLLGYTLDERWGQRSPQIGNFIGSFKRLTDRRALSVEPARVEVVDLQRSLPIQTFQQNYPSSIPIETLALINHVAPNGSLQGGEAAKRVIGGVGQGQ